MSAKANRRYLSLPVNRTGVYFNQPMNRLEYWFFWKDKKCCIGQCRMNLPQSAKDHWEAQASEGLLQELARAVSDGTIRVRPEDVLQAMK